MNTENMRKREDDKPGARLYELRGAIASIALVREADGALIMGSENSGAREPWLFDFRALMLQPRWLDTYAEIFWEKYADSLPFQVAGVESAGISLVAAIVMKSMQRGTPVNGFYIRKSRKRHGLMKYIEGTPTDEPVIFVDDLINSGKTANKQIEILRQAGMHVREVFVMLAFRAKTAYSFFETKQVSFSSLFTLEDFAMPLLSERSVQIPSNVFEVLWQFKSPSPSFHLVVEKSAPVTDGDRVYFGCDDGVFRALDARTGDVAWQFSVGRHPAGKGILSSPTLHDGTVFFGAYDGTVYALNAQTGSERWRFADADWVGSSPDIAPELGLVFVGLEFGLWWKRGGIAALDINTGTPRWTASHAGLTHGSPLYISKESLVVIGSNDGTLYAYDAKTGKSRWTFAARGDIKGKPAYDADRRLIVFGAMNGNVYALAANDGTPVYARETGAGIYATPLVHDGTVYIASLDKCLYAIPLGDWKDRWVHETSGRIFASPRIVDGSLWIGSNDGRLYELDPVSGAQKSFFQASERIVNAITDYRGRLFVPTVANEIFCIRRKEADRSEHT